MSGFGTTLKFAREQKGLSIAQVSEMTRLSQTMIELLENDNFSMVPAPLYGRGFVKLISQAVGLEVKPMVEMFMQLYAEKDSLSRLPPRPSAAEHISAEPPPAASPLRMEQPRAAEPAPVQPPKVIPPSRYAAPQPIDERPSLATLIFHQLHRIPSQVWRIATLALGAAVLVTLVFFGVRSLYRATSAAPVADGETSEETTIAESAGVPETASTGSAGGGQGEIRQETADTGAQPAAKPRRGTVIEPLYVD